MVLKPAVGCKRSVTTLLPCMADKPTTVAIAHYKEYDSDAVIPDWANATNHYGPAQRDTFPIYTNVSTVALASRPKHEALATFFEICCAICCPRPRVRCKGDLVPYGS